MIYIFKNIKKYLKARKKLKKKVYTLKNCLVILVKKYYSNHEKDRGFETIGAKNSPIPNISEIEQNARPVGGG